jgi:glutamyl-tRNA reductase
VLGETEILGQLKQAYDLALKHKHTGARLNKAFQRAFNVAKHIRTATGIQRGSISVASVAVELAEKIFSSLADRQVMVIGAGDTSEKTARALLSRPKHPCHQSLPRQGRGARRRVGWTGHPVRRLGGRVCRH